MMISIHAPTRGATFPSTYLSLFLLFQSTLLQEERPVLVISFLVPYTFQSTLLQEERHLLMLKALMIFQDFNPRSYKRSDEMLLRIRTTVWISIHAPTRGATVVGSLKAVQLHIISIHAPTRGATGHNMANVVRLVFQSTLLQEERRSEYPPIIHIPLFQSTLLQEERRLSLEPGNQIPDFNPRSYKRSDFLVIVSQVKADYFNPRSYKRSDTASEQGALRKSDFNPRSYKRSDNFLFLIE